MPLSSHNRRQKSTGFIRSLISLEAAYTGKHGARVPGYGGPGFGKHELWKIRGLVGKNGVSVENKGCKSE